MESTELRSWNVERKSDVARISKISHFKMLQSDIQDVFLLRLGKAENHDPGKCSMQLPMSSKEETADPIISPQLPYGFNNGLNLYLCGEVWGVE